MEPVLVPVESHQFWLHEPSRRRGFPLRETNGLVAVTGPGAAMIFGISSGRVSVRAEALTTAPAVADLGEWDEIADVSLPGLAGELAVAALMDDVPPGLPGLCAAGPGDYRVRVHARGRDTSPGRGHRPAGRGVPGAVLADASGPGRGAQAHRPGGRRSPARFPVIDGRPSTGLRRSP
jgi:hypothetical protein